MDVRWDVLVPGIGLVLGWHSFAVAAPRPQRVDGLQLVPVARGLDRPLYATSPAGDPRLFIVEQGGRVRILENGRLRPVPFLDLSREVSEGGERGLLGLAFHPRFALNRLFFVNYTDRNGSTRVDRFRVGADPQRADPASRQTILEIRQPYSNHNGGMVLFGPDGMLYIGMGDGGSARDPQGHGQDRRSLLGDLLRIDVDRGPPYGVPPDNPFAGQADKRGEIWAWGLRNPWRFDFDPVDRLLYIADVGQDRWEEINVVPSRAAGLNFGWGRMEGNHCIRSGCDTTGLTVPALEYSHEEGCSVTGGFVYRGRRIPSLQGHYFYADYCSRWIRSFRYIGGRLTGHREWRLQDPGPVLSFGRDAAGELYVCSGNGTVYRIESAP